MSRLGFASAFSLLILLSIVASWLRSYFVADIVSRENDRYGVAVCSARGCVDIICVGSHDPLPPHGPRVRVDFGYEKGDPALAGCRGMTFTSGFYWPRIGIGYAYDGWLQMRAVIVPHWLLASVFLVLPIGSLRGARRQKPEHACTSCGYDLRASKDRCPECGAAIQVIKGEKAARERSRSRRVPILGSACDKLRE